MNTEAKPADSPKSGGLWKFFTSVRLTVALLLTLAATSIIGTLIPQNESPEAYRQAFGEFLYRFFSVLDVFDMYHSWWFQCLVVLLTINVVVCSLDRFATTWKIVFPGTPIFNLARYRSDRRRIEFEIPVDVESLRLRVQQLVYKKFGRHRNEDGRDGFVVFAEKWRWTRLGVYVVHLSVVLLLIGGLIGSLFGFEGFVNIAEGETVEKIRLRNTGEEVRLPFAVRCDDFSVSFYESGMPKEYRSRLTVVENGQPVMQQDILVNAPLRYKGINLFQSSYGEIPPQMSASGLPETVTLAFTSKETGMVYQKKLQFGESVELPENLGQFQLKEFRDDYDFRGTHLGATLIGTLSRETGPLVEVVLPLRFPSFDRMAPMFDSKRTGAVFIAVETFDAPKVPSEKRYYTGLQVTKDPGVGVVYAGFVLMIIGCIITFFMSHQRLCVEVVRSGGASRVIVAGNANKNKLGMRRKVEKIATQLGAPPPAGSPVDR